MALQLRGDDLARALIYDRDGVEMDSALQALGILHLACNLLDELDVATCERAHVRAGAPDRPSMQRNVSRTHGGA